jgi:hypothetical protein
MTSEVSRVAYTVRKVKILAAKARDKVGALADLLEPLAQSKVSLDALVGYAHKPGGACKVHCSLADTGKRALKTAGDAGFEPDETSAALIVEGPDRAGAGQEIAQAAAGAGVNLRVCVAMSVGTRVIALLGFDSDADAGKVARRIRTIGAKKVAKKRTGTKRATK